MSAAERPIITDHVGATVLTAEECGELLRRHALGRLAVSVCDLPDIFPVNYAFHCGSVVFRTSGGTKLAGALLGRGVAFEVDGVDASSGQAWSVVVKGRAVELEAVDERRHAGAQPVFPLQRPPKAHFVRIEPISISGRRFETVTPDVWAEPPR